MLRAILRGQIRRMEREFDYDASYMSELLDADLVAFLKFSLITSVVPRRAAPAAALAAAGLVGTLAEDCGPCTQISVEIASRAGVKPEVLRGILAGDAATMGEDASLAYRFAKASLARDIEQADPLRDEVVRRWGQKGLAALALALTTARMYPTMKYAMGHGRACSRVLVAGEPAPFQTQLADAA
ncbi:MAG TPA: hypothetical protein VKU90_06980 [Caulobacteraceae bacterium]|nr:hypothetical protein [Caulobacteraceae bacterium]